VNINKGENKMNFLDLAKQRHSVRKYTNQKIEETKLNSILIAGQVAPTGGNKQPQKLIVVQSEEGLSKISKGANIFNPPLAIIVCTDAGIAWERPYDGKNLADIDATIVTDHMMLQATDLGLGTVWVDYFDPEIIKSEFNLPENLEPLHILVVGYSNSEPLSPNRHSETRKPLSETVVFENL